MLEGSDLSRDETEVSKTGRPGAASLGRRGAGRGVSEGRVCWTCFGNSEEAVWFRVRDMHFVQDLVNRERLGLPSKTDGKSSAGSEHGRCDLTSVINSFILSSMLRTDCRSQGQK